MATIEYADCAGGGDGLMGVLRSRVATFGASVLVFALAMLGISELAIFQGMHVRINAVQWNVFGPPESVYSWRNLALPRYVVVLMTMPIALWLAHSWWRLVRGSPRYSVGDLIIVTTVVALIVWSILAPYDNTRSIWPVVTYSISAILATGLVIRDARRNWSRLGDSDREGPTPPLR